MKKIFLFLIPIVLLLAFLGIWFLFRFAPSPLPPGNSAGELPLPDLPSFPGNQSGKPGAPGRLELSGREGIVSVQDFYPGALEVNPQRDALIQSAPQFSITYNAGDSSFIISILSLPFESSRAAAEEAFLKTLDIPKAEACRLKVVEAVPFEVSAELSGREYHLSFCY